MQTDKLKRLIYIGIIVNSFINDSIQIITLKRELN